MSTTSHAAGKKHPSHRKRAHKPKAAKPGLEVYAFWTGFASTLISLLHVLILASKG